MAYFDTTSRRRRPRFPRREPRERFPDVSAEAQGQPQTESYPTRQPEAAPQYPPAVDRSRAPKAPPITVNPMPLPGPIGQPAGFSPKVERPKILTDVESLLTSRLGTTVESDPRYQSQLTDLVKTQDLRKKQRIEDLKRLGILQDEGPGFEAFDTLSEISNREKLNLTANIENLRRGDTQDALSLAGQQGAYSQQDISNTLSGLAMSNTMINDALSRAVAQGEATGEYVDPQTGESYDTLTRVAQDRAYALSKGELTGEFEEPEGEPGAPGSPDTLTGYAAGAAPRAFRPTLRGRAQEQSEEAQYGGRWEEDENGEPIWVPTEAARAAGVGEGFRSAEISGVVPLLNSDGTPALDEKGQQRMGTTLDAQRLGLQTAETFGGRTVIDPTAKGGTRWQDTLAGGKLALDRINSAMDRAIAAGNATGEYIDPETGKSYDTLSSQALDLQTAETFGQAGPVAPGRLTEIARATKAREEFTEAGLTGLLDGRVTLPAELSRAEFNQRERAQKASISQADRALSQREQEMYGGSTTRDPATGEMKFRPTLDFQKWSADQKFRYAAFAEDTRVNRVNERIAWADKLGFAGEPGKLSTADFTEAMADSQAGQPFDPAFDDNGDGKVDNDDFFDMVDKNLLSNKTFTTLEGKQTQANIRNAARALGLDEKRFKEGIRQFNEGLTASQKEFMTRATGLVSDENGNPIFKKVQVESLPFNREEAIFISQALGEKPNGQLAEDEAGYNLAFDMNEDGILTMAEFLAALETTVGQEGKGGVYRIMKTREEKISTLELQQFKDDQNRFNQTFQNSINNFMSQLGLDEKRLKSLSDAQWIQLAGTLAAAGMGALGAYLGRSRSTSGVGVSTARPTTATDISR